MALIRDIAKACKSKNAGPFEITIDVVFDERSMYDACSPPRDRPQLFARLYNVPPEDVLFTRVSRRQCIKATLPRPVASGDVGDTDVYGAQQHAPLLDVDIPFRRVPVSRKIAAKRKRSFDPIDLEILWNRLVLVADEAAYAIVRTSMSKVVVEGRDFGSLLLDAQGRLLAADVSVASKTGTISIAVRELLRHMPAESFRPGDMVATNNPWWIMGHLNDIAGHRAPLPSRAGSSPSPSAWRTWPTSAARCRARRARCTRKG
jgi:hypothetical protein